MAETDIYKIKLGSDTYNLPFLPLSGGTMSGNITLGNGNAILGSGNSIPAKFKDAAVINPEVHSVWLAAIGTDSNNAAGSEASGILFDGNTIKMWSPLDNSPLIIDSDDGKSYTLLHSGNITKDHVGLGNVENTTLSTWAGSSNLTTCSKGTFGSIVTKNSGDYLSVTGGTLSGQLFTQYSTNNSTIVPASSSLIIGHSPNKAGHTGYHTGIGFNALCYGSYINHNHAWIGLGKYTTTASAECYPLVFATNESTTTNTSPIERMSIAPNGNVNIKKNLSVDGSLTVDGSNVLTSITSTMVTNALGYTPYNSTNPNGYITSSGSITGNAATSTYASRLGDSSAYHTKATIDTAINGKWAWNSADVAGVKVNNAVYADSAGSAPASDVYGWAKASAKPSYNFGEIGAGIATIGDGANRLMFRTHDSYRSGIYYSTPGNEALVFGNKNPVTSWIFATTDPNSQNVWNALTPSLQIKNGRVTINKLIPEAANADYNLDVNGSVNATTLYEAGSRVALDGHTHGYWTWNAADVAGVKVNSASSADSATKATNDSDGNAINSTYLKKSGGTLTGALTFGDGAQGMIKYGTHTSSGLKGITLPGLGSAGIGIFSRAGKSTDEGGIIITEDSCLIYNSFDAGWGFSIHDKDLNQTDISSDATKVFGITQDNYYAWSRGGYKKEGSSNDYVLLGGGGHKAISDFLTSLPSHTHTKAQITDFPTSLPANGGNADTVGDKSVSDFARFYLSPMTSNAPADSAKSWFTDTMPSGSGAIVYNVPGSEKTIIVGKSSGAFGHMLQLNYDDNYLRILRYFSGSWKTTDWEKISAGYADSAGTADTATNVAWTGVTGKPTTFTPATHTHTSFSNNIAVTGKVSATQGFYEESDERLKSFKDPIKVDLEKLSKLRKSYFTFNSDPDNLQIGVSAQEIQSLYPELVSENENGNLTVAYDKLSVIALAAVDQLSEENTKLKQQNEEILKRLEKIEKLLSI